MGKQHFKEWKSKANQNRKLLWPLLHNSKDFYVNKTTQMKETFQALVSRKNFSKIRNLLQARSEALWRKGLRKAKMEIRFRSKMASPGEASLQNKIGLTLLRQWGQTTRGEWREKIKSADRNLGQL